MFDFVADNGLSDGFSVFLVFEFRRVAADDHEFVGIFLFEIFQVGQNVDAVDAAVRPEVDQHDLAAHIFQ